MVYCVEMWIEANEQHGGLIGPTLRVLFLT